MFNLKINRYIIIIITLLISCSLYGQIDSVKIYLNHANTHFWLGREWKNSLNEFHLSRSYIEKAETFLKAHKLDSSLRSTYIRKILEFKKELSHADEICIDNLNGRFPLYMSLMGRKDNYEFIDTPIEIACERAIQEVLDKNTIKPTKPLSELMNMAVIEVHPYDPTLVEVCAQYINNQSNTYVISRHEIADIFKEDKKAFSTEDLNKIASYYKLRLVGHYIINIKDQVDKIHYAEASYNLVDTKANNFMSQSMGEGFIVDKTEDHSDIIFHSLVYGYLIPVFILLLFNLIIDKLFWSKKWKKVKELGLMLPINLLSFVFSAIVSFVLIHFYSKVAPASEEFYLNFEAKLWMITVPLIFSFFSVVLSFIVGSLLLKNLFKSEETRLVAYIQGGILGAIFPFTYSYFLEDLHYLEIYIYFISIILILLTTCFSAKNIFEFEKSRSGKKHLIFSMVYLLPITYLCYHLLLVTFTSSNLVIGLLTLIITITIIDYWLIDKIASIFSKNEERDEIHSSKLKNFNKELMASINSEEKSTFIPFELEKETQFNNIVNQSIKEDSKIGVIHINSPKGNGKTRFLKEWIKNNNDYKVFYGDCDEFQDGNTIPYEPFAEAFGEFIGKGRLYKGDKEAKAVLMKARPALEESPGGNLFLSMLDSNSFEGASIAEITKVFESFFETEILGSDGKTLSFAFVLEDIHWIDPNSKELLLSTMNMLSILKRKHNFNFLLILSSDINNNQIRLGTEEYNSMLNRLRAKDRYSYSEIFNSKDTCLVSNRFCEAYLSEFKYISSKARHKIFDQLTDLGYVQPSHVLESLKFMIDHQWFEEINESIELIGEVKFSKLPLPRNLKIIFEDNFEKLDDDLKRILETAAFIGDKFEANILAGIWKMNRLDLLHKLRIAEELGFVNDLSDKDDVYEFTNKSIMGELREIASKGLPDGEKPQIVKEYHKMITKIMVEEKNIDPNTYNLSIVKQLADRTFFNKEQMYEEAFRFNLASAKRMFENGENKGIDIFIERLNIIIKEYNLKETDILQTRVIEFRKNVATNGMINNKMLINEIEDRFENLAKEDHALLGLYELYIIDLLKDSFDDLRDQNNREENQKFMENLLSREEIIDTDLIRFAKKFYEIEAKAVKENQEAEACDNKDEKERKKEISNKEKISCLIKLKDQMSGHERSCLDIYGRVLNSLGIAQKSEISKQHWRERIILILEKYGVELMDKDFADEVNILQKSFHKFSSEDKLAILFSFGALARYLKDVDGNSLISLKYFKVLSSLNEVFGNYQGYSMAVNYLGSCYIGLLEDGKLNDSFKEVDQFFDTAYYKLENAYINKVDISSEKDGFDQFGLILNWTEFLYKVGANKDQFKNLLGAFDDYINKFQNDNGEILLVDKFNLKEKFSDIKQQVNIDQFSYIVINSK